MITTAPVRAQRSRKLVSLSVAVVALLAGVALAVFISTATVTGNSAAGASLVAGDFLPVNVSGLYPGDTKTENRTLANGNPVDIEVDLAAAATGATATAGTDEADQYAALNIRIATPCDPENPLDTEPFNGGECSLRDGGGDFFGFPGETVHYNGAITDLTELDELIQVPAAGSVDIEFKITLINDPDNAQPQSTTSTWDFNTSTQTPPTPSGGGFPASNPVEHSNTN